MLGGDDNNGQCAIEGEYVEFTWKQIFQVKKKMMLYSTY